MRQVEHAQACQTKGGRDEEIKGRRRKSYHGKHGRKTVMELDTHASILAFAPIIDILVILLELS